MNRRIAIWGSLLVIFFGESTVAGAPRLSFVHLNDTYRVGTVEDGTRGGFGRVVTVIRDLQQQGIDVRVLHGGDFLFPSLESQIWNGLQMVDAMNFIDDLAPLYVVPGNHEFDRRTPEHLVNALQASRFDWLGDNFRFVTGDAEADARLEQTLTIEAAGLTIGVFALTLHAADGGNDRNYVPIDRDYTAIARRSIERLETRGVDVIVGLTHLHMHQDIEIAQLRKAHPKLAFIAGGHEHEPEFSRFSAESAAVIKGASNARIIWRIDLDIDDAGLPVVDAELLDMNENVAVDAEYALLADKWRGRLLERFPFLEAQVGTAAIRFDATEQHVRNRESAWGNFIVDQMLTAFGEPPADFAFINSGTLRIDDFIIDDIRFEDIGRTFGFSSFLRHMTMSGSEFRNVMEAGFRGEGNSKGYFPQIAGFRVCVDKSLPSGSRIVSLQVPGDLGWQDIDPDAEYMVVVPDFLYRGGDGYRMPTGRSASSTGPELKYLVLDAILAAQSAGQAVGTPVDSRNPRIVLMDDNRSECF